jgi:hypothetical protein
MHKKLVVREIVTEYNSFCLDHETTTSWPPVASAGSRA